MNKRILIVQPPFYRLYHPDFVLANHPLALGYLARAVLDKTDWQVQTMNADYSKPDKPFSLSHGYLAGQGFDRYLEALNNPEAPVWKEVEAAIRQSAPGVVGLSAKSQDFSSARRVARIVKSVDPGILVVLGGPHASLAGEAALSSCPEIDLVVRGEGEATLPHLLTAFGQGDSLDDVPGLILRDGTGCKTTASRPFVQDLDSLGWPHFAAKGVLVDFEKYPVSAFGNIFATRGCPYSCLYCGSRYIWSRKPRFRSPANVVGEMLALQEMGVPRINFDDDTFGVSRNYIRALCTRMENSGVRTPWSCEMHVKLVDEEIIGIMRRAGCVLIFLGVESGDDRVLRDIRKHITFAQAKRACEIIRAADIQLYTFFMVGLPSETRASMLSTYQAMKTIGADYLVYSIFTPYPSTEAFEQCRGLGVVDDGFDVSLYNHQSPKNCFSPHIKPEEFRALASEMEAFVDAYNQEMAGRRVRLRMASEE